MNYFDLHAITETHFRSNKLYFFRFFLFWCNLYLESKMVGKNPLKKLIKTQAESGFFFKIANITGYFSLRGGALSQI